MGYTINLCLHIGLFKRKSLSLHADCTVCEESQLSLLKSIPEVQESKCGKRANLKGAVKERGKASKPHKSNTQRLFRHPLKPGVPSDSASTNNMLTTKHFPSLQAT